jgi:hypothetical protein
MDFGILIILLMFVIKYVQILNGIIYLHALIDKNYKLTQMIIFYQ